MGDMAEGFREMTKARKLNRANNTVASTNLLLDSGIVFVSKNNGAHLIISAKNEIIDFWPSTGLWIVRSIKRKHRGVFNLIRNYGEPKNG